MFWPRLISLRPSPFRPSWAWVVPCLSWLSWTATATAAEYYVSADGSDEAAGTEAAPFASLTRAQQAAAPGDTVWVHGGTYAFSSGTVGVAFSKSGQMGKPIRYFAVAGEAPHFDLSAVAPTARITGFDITADYLHIRGMEVTGVRQFRDGEDSWGVRIRGSHNVLEQLNVHHNEAPGVFITSGSDNHVLNCDSHHNYDVLESGGSGDGFGCHSTGGNNILSGCRAWENSDDGYDFINAPGSCLVEDSWAWRNGWIPDTENAAGNGAGFKSGGFGLDSSRFPADLPVHEVHRCVAWNNRTQGFYANHHPGALRFYNNTAYDNPRNYDMLDDVGEARHVLRNNIAFGRGGALSNSTPDDSQYNSWDRPAAPSAADFTSLDSNGADGPRRNDGRLPVLTFLHLSASSNLIDSGVDVGLNYNGDAPDLGAFESGPELTPPAEPTAGAGGAGGDGGDAGQAGEGGEGNVGGAAGSGDPGGSPATPSETGGMDGAGPPVQAPNAGAGGATTGGQPAAAPGSSGGTGEGGAPAAAGSAGAADSAGGALPAASDNTTNVDPSAGCSCSTLGLKGETHPLALLWLTLGAALAWQRRSRRAAQG